MLRLIDLQFVYNSGKLKLPPRLELNMSENECKHSEMDFFFLAWVRRRVRAGDGCGEDEWVGGLVLFNCVSYLPVPPLEGAALCQLLNTAAAALYLYLYGLLYTSTLPVCSANNRFVPSAFKVQRD